MKKITFLLLLIAPLFIFSQSYYMDFGADADKQGWIAAGLLLNTVSPNPASGVLQVDGQGSGTTAFPAMRLPLTSSPVGSTLTYSDYTVVRIVAENATNASVWQLINHDNGDDNVGNGEKTDFDMPIVTAGSGYTTFDVVLPTNASNATGLIDQIAIRAKNITGGLIGTLKIDQIVIINTITVDVVTNGTFEDGGGSLTPWTVNGPDISATLVAGNEGGNAARLTFDQDATNNNSYDNVVYDFGQILPAQTLTVTWDQRSNNTALETQFNFKTFLSGASTGNFSGVESNTVADTWESLSLNKALGADFDQIIILPRIQVDPAATAGDYVEIDNVSVFVNYYNLAPPVTDKTLYDFATDDTTGFSSANGTVTDGGTTLDFNADGASTTPGFVQDFYTIDASSKTNLFFVVDANGSTADEIQFSFKDPVSESFKFYGWKPLNSGSPTYVSYIDLISKSEWTGEIAEWQIRTRVNAGGNVDAGTVSISKIAFFGVGDTNQSLANGTWSNDAIWLYGQPISTQNVTIDNAITIATDATTNDLTIDTGSLTINSGASLIVNGSSSGDITYNRNLGTSNWYLVASPFVGQDVDDFVTAEGLETGSGSNLGLGTYNTSDDTWTYYQSGTSNSDTFNAGQGYIVNLSGASGDIAFTGTLLTTDLTPISLVTTGSGFNLSGNPYPSFIDSAAMLTGSSGSLDSQTLWIWDQSLNGGSGAYETKVTADNFKIAPGQGFFVQSDGAAGTLAINESFQSHESSDSFLRNELRPEVHLNLTNGTNEMKTKLYFINGTTTGFDNGFDGPMFGGVTNDFDIYTQEVENATGRDLAIQSLPDGAYENLIVPVGINAAFGTEITISASSVNLPAGIEIYLEDKESNTFTLLDAASDFTTTLTSDLNGIGRFYLYTTSSVLSLNDNSVVSNLQIYTTASKRELIVKGQLSGVTTADLYDLQGRLILRNKLDQYSIKSTIDISGINSGIYVVKVDSGNQTKTQKVIIR